MALTAGDIIFKATADTSSLDTALAKIQSSAEAALTPAKEQAAQLGAALDGAAVSAGELSATMPEAAQGATQASSAWQKWAVATAENQKAQGSLRNALRQLSQTEGESVAITNMVAQAKERATLAAQAEAAAFKEAMESATGLATVEKEIAVGATEMGVSIAAADAEFSMHEAKGSMALIGEEIGVKIPRHIRGFIAELPGVGAAMSAAFSGFALFALVEVLVEASHKLTEFVSETFIYTEENKKAYEAQVELNKAIAEHATKIKDLKKEYANFGLTPWQQQAKDLHENTVELEKQKKALSDAKEESKKYAGEIDELNKSMALAAKQGATIFDGKELTELQEKRAEAERKIALAQKVIEESKAKDLLLQKKTDKEALDELMAHGEATLNAQKTINNAKIELLRAQSNLELAQTNASYYQRALAENKFEEQQYQREREHLEKEKGLLAQDPTKNADRIKQINADIEALDDKHRASELKKTTEFYEAINDATKQLAGLKTPTLSLSLKIAPDGLTDEQRAINDLIALMNQFGIQGSVIWHKQAEDAQKAYDKMKASGVATYADLLQMQEQLIRAKIGEAFSIGDKTGANELQKQLDEVNAQLVKIGITTDRTRQKGQQLFNMWGTQIPKDRNLWKDFGKIADNAFMQFTEGMASAISSSELGSQSFGQAMAQMTASVLAGISAQCAILSLFYLAKGFGYTADFMYLPAENAFQASALFGAAALASGAAAYGISSSTNGSESDSTSAPSGTAGITTTGSAGQPESTPVSVTNVQHFAAGGLVTQRTLAVVGDSITSASRSAKEAILPLENPEVMGYLASEIASRIPSQGASEPPSVTVNVHGKPLKSLIKEINTEVTKKGAQLTSSKTSRLLRKS